MATTSKKRSAKELSEELLSSVDLSFPSQAVIPGDDVTACVTKQSKRLQLGSGLFHDTKKDIVLAVRAGILRYSPPATYWVESKSMKRYVPCVEDAVIGIVDERLSSFYRISLNGTLPGTLPLLAFEGATKRTKPTLKNGDAVYLRIVSAPKDIEPECSCISVFGTRKGWETNESTFGVLEGGILIQCTLSQATQLRADQNHPIFKALEKQGCKFEIVIGANGLIWIKADSPRITICVSNAIKNALVLDPGEVRPMVKRLFEMNKEREVDQEKEEEESE